MSDINLLKVMLERKQFSSLYKNIELSLYDANTQAMLKWFNVYFKNYEAHDRIDLETLKSLIKLKTKVTDKTEESMALTNAIIRNLSVPLDPEVKATTLNALEEKKLAAESAQIITRYEAGDEIDIVFELNKLASAVRQRMELHTQAAWCDTDIWELIQANADDSGYILDFLPKEIYENIKGVNEGNNIAIAAPTDKGKTAMLTKLAVSFAVQRMKRMLKDTDMMFRPVLYLVNEGTAEVITPRVYQTALNLTREELYQRGAKGTIKDDYIAVMGRSDAIRLVNIHGKSVAQVVRIIEAHNPFLVITDMTGRIRCSGGGNGANDIAQLEEVWNDMRMFAAMMNFIHVGTAQISAEGFDNLYPPLSALQNSKTGIQTTLDLAIYMGAYANSTPDNELIRGISTPKNKLVRSGKRSLNKCAIYVDLERNIWDDVIS